jgi:hypothetical protein
MGYLALSRILMCVMLSFVFASYYFKIYGMEALAKISSCVIENLCKSNVKLNKHINCG